MKPVLVLLPGLDGTGVLFRPLLPFLSPEFQPVVVAYPPDRRLGYRELLPVVLAALPRSGPFLILGESFSGPLALLAAATRPAGLVGVVLCASFVRSPLRFGSTWLAPLVRPFAFRLCPQFVTARVLLGAWSTPALRALLAEALSTVRPGVLAHRVRAVLRIDVLKELQACPVPVLYIRASHDRVVSARALTCITAARPGVQVAQLAAPHLALQTQPGAASSAISSFFGEAAGVKSG